MGGERAARKAERRQQVDRTWFYFYSSGHARSYRWLFYVVQLLGPIGIILALTAPGNWVVAAIGLAVGVSLNACYHRTWIKLCRQAHPPVPRVHWFTSGLVNPLTRRALKQATVHLREQ